MTGLEIIQERLNKYIESYSKTHKIDVECKSDALIELTMKKGKVKVCKKIELNDYDLEDAIYELDEEMKGKEKMEKNEKKETNKYQELQELDVEIKKLQCKQKTIKDDLIKQLTDANVKEVKNKYCTVSFTDDKEETVIDLVMLEEKEADLYNELLADYPIVKTRKGGYKFTPKKEGKK